MLCKSIILQKNSSCCLVVTESVRRPVGTSLFLSRNLFRRVSQWGSTSKLSKPAVATHHSVSPTRSCPLPALPSAVRPDTAQPRHGLDSAPTRPKTAVAPHVPARRSERGPRLHIRPTFFVPDVFLLCSMQRKCHSASAFKRLKQRMLWNSLFN